MKKIALVLLGLLIAGQAVAGIRARLRKAAAIAVNTSSVAVSCPEGTPVCCAYMFVNWTTGAAQSFGYCGRWDETECPTPPRGTFHTECGALPPAEKDGETYFADCRVVESPLNGGGCGSDYSREFYTDETTTTTLDEASTTTTEVTDTTTTTWHDNGHAPGH